MQMISTFEFDFNTFVQKVTLLGWVLKFRNTKVWPKPNFYSDLRRFFEKPEYSSQKCSLGLNT